jgi:hypothetical protein
VEDLKFQLFIFIELVRETLELCRKIENLAMEFNGFIGISEVKILLDNRHLVLHE